MEITLVKFLHSTYIFSLYGTAKLWCGIDNWVVAYVSVIHACRKPQSRFSVRFFVQHSLLGCGDEEDGKVICIEVFPNEK
jgi:hypothetical protein